MISLLALFACQTETPATPEPAPAAKVETKDKTPEVKHAGLFKVLPAEAPSKVERTKALVDLGRMLYYDPRLSKNHDISCNSCHMLDKYGVDNEPTSPGHKGVRGARNSPTTYNAAFHLAQFWDGREPTVEAQAKGPVLNPVEMGMADDAAVVAVLESIPGYVEAFKAAFPGQEKPITYDNFGTAVGAFERGLVTKDRFDKYLGGDTNALTDEEKAGLDLFVSTGCTTCHLGATVGGNMYQKLGLVQPYETKDMGRFEHTKKESDKLMFKVPSLRNVEKTAPYFHDGSIATLDEAIKLMAGHQLGKQLKKEEIDSIATFLKALTGELPTEYIKKPELPASGPNTPKADPS